MDDDDDLTTQAVDLLFNSDTFKTKIRSVYPYIGCFLAFNTFILILILYLVIKINTIFD